MQNSRARVAIRPVKFHAERIVRPILVLLKNNQSFVKHARDVRRVDQIVNSNLWQRKWNGINDRLEGQSVCIITSKHGFQHGLQSRHLLDYILGFGHTTDGNTLFYFLF